MSEPESDGKRLGRMMATEPELTSPIVTDADRERSRRFETWLFAEGFDWGKMAARMERLKFETIVTGKTYGQVLADLEEP